MLGEVAKHKVQITHALARMVHPDNNLGADVLILDEGTSALDRESEGMV